MSSVPFFPVPILPDFESTKSWVYGVGEATCMKKSNPIPRKWLVSIWNIQFWSLYMVYTHLPHAPCMCDDLMISRCLKRVCGPSSCLCSIVNVQQQHLEIRPEGCRSTYTCAEHAEHFSSDEFLDIFSGDIAQKNSPLDKPECIYLLTSSRVWAGFDLPHGSILSVVDAQRDAANLPTVSLGDNAYL